MSLRNLKWFDKFGNNLTPTLSDGIFKFNIFFQPVSTGLFESEHIFVLEEILEEKPNTYQVKSGPRPKDFLEIEIFRFLRDYNDLTPKSVLEREFPITSIHTDYINEFVENYSSYVVRKFIYDKEYYSLTTEGKIYIDDYDEKIRNIEASAYNLEPTLVRPRSSYNQKIDDNIDEYYEETFFYFKWKENTYDRNIFVYFIDYNPDQLYYEGSKSLCLDEGKVLPSIIPLYDKFLNVDSSNPTWNLWFSPYIFDNGRNDDYEWNNNVDWVEGGVIPTTIGYQEKTDELGRRLFQGRRILNSDKHINKKPFQFNFAIHSEIEGEFNRTLEIYAVKTTRISYYDYNDDKKYKNITKTYKVAEINFYGEVIAEDERLEKMLENFGRRVDEEDVYVFRDTEVDDDRPDYIKLNEKRKELLLVSEDIFPYMGSYKSFVNVLKFFGFQDLKLKEYFINTIISEPVIGKLYYSAVEIPLDLKVDDERLSNKNYNELVYGDLVDSDIFYKSSRFGLYYNINSFSGNFDEDGWPIVEDNYQYTNEEILIKLFGLKKVLERLYLPHHVRIIDITGEGIYFIKTRVNSWQDLNPIIPLSFEENPDFIAKPLKSYIKPLDRLINIFRKTLNEINDTGYFDKNGNYHNEGITQYTKLENILHCSIYEFINGGKKDFPFDQEVSLDIIKKFYPTYFDLKNAIFNHLHNTICADKYSKKDISQAFLHTIKMFGVPVVLKLVDFIVTWEDVPVRYEYVENDLLKTKEEINATWDNIGKNHGNEITWFVRHENDKYCWSQRGFVKDINEIMIFLPFVGFYDVSCVVLDSQNFPMMRKKKKYIEILKETPDFTAFGRFLDPGKTFDQHFNDTWEKFEGSWEISSYCPLSTNWDEAKINWDSLNYQLYLNQNFVSNYKISEILEIDESDYFITLKGPEFFYNQEKINQKRVNNLILENSPKNIPIKNNIDVLSFDNLDNIIISGKWDIKTGDKINLYRYFETQQFVIDENKIKINTNFLEGFEIGREIKLYTAYEHKEYKYIILNVEADFINNIIILTVENDNSLTDLPFNLLSYRGNDNLYKVINAIYNNYNNSTTLIVNDPYHYIRKISKKINLGSGINTIYEWKVEYGILSGYYVFEVLNVDLKDNNSIVRIKPNNDLCYTDIRFVAKFDDYDMNWALKHANSRTNVWDNLDNVKYENGEYQTWDLQDYHGDIIMGFKIIQCRDTGILYFNGVPINYDISSCGENDKWYFLADFLTDHINPLVNIFNYKVIDNSYIYATAKSFGSRYLVSLKASLGTKISLDSYPKLNFNKWENDFYPGDNNPAMWNPIKRIWQINNSIFNNINNTKSNVLPYSWGVNGAFTFNDTFIRHQDFSIPKFTTIFIIFDNDYEITASTKFYWELWEETKQNLIMKSEYKYLLFNFVESGIYSIYLKIIDENGNEIKYNKKSWINVLEKNI